MRQLTVSAAIVLCLARGAPALPGEPAASSPFRKASAPDVRAVRVEGGFWGPRLRACLDVTLPHCYRICEETGRIRNFLRAAGKLGGAFEGLHFNDSDVYKVVEGTEWALAAIGRDDELDRRADEVVAAIAAAQDADGYLDTFFPAEKRGERFRHIFPDARHELYCMGHAIEAGAVRFELSGKRDLLSVAERLADHIASLFGPGKRGEVPEHQELELALIRLAGVTGDRRHLELARWFIEERGNAAGHGLYGDYAQDHVPFRRRSEIVGHAVRAMYECLGAADLYAETGDAELLAALRRLWESATRRKMYVTGGIGATARNEAFGADWDLPNESAYAETCAQIGLALLAHRLLLIEPDAEYADVLERVLYNGFLSGIGLSGDRFFYRNLLASDGSYRRVPWYDCACCPSNVVRLLPRVGQLAYAVSGDTIWTHLYVQGVARLDVGGKPVTIRQRTRYPWDGMVRLEVDPGEPRVLDLRLRIPGWCRDRETPGGLYRLDPDGDTAPSITVNGERPTLPRLDRGYARLRRAWNPGDVIGLDVPMPVLRVRADPRVAADRGRVALQRGPVVYCLEDSDHGVPVRDLRLPPAAALRAEHRPDLLGGVTVILGKGSAAGKDAAVDVVAVPYHAWDHREGGGMAVWVVEDPDRAGPARTAGWVGSNYTPAFCSNQIQMWSDFRPEVIERELAAARKHLGITCLRVFLHDIVHRADREAFLGRIESFVQICARHGIRPGFVFFDDCHRRDGIGLEPLPPVKGWHNGRWASCPQGRDRTPEMLPALRAYVQDVVRAHAKDPRVLWWEVFNEPDMGAEYSVKLRRDGYAWAKELEPIQPVLCSWDDSPETDIVDAHAYSADFAAWDRQADLNPAKGCLFTEAGARWYAHRASSGEPCEVVRWLASRKAAGKYVPGVCLTWELMVGDSNCRWYWGTEPETPEPTIPWCGLLWPDGTPVSLAEAEAIRRHATGEARALLYEDFEGRGATLDLPEGWTAYGAPGGRRGALELPPDLKVVAGDGSWSDYVLEARVLLRGTEGNAGVIFRVNDPGPGADAMRGYYAGLDARTLYLGRMENSWRELASFDLTKLECKVEPGVWSQLRVAAEGPRIRVWLNRMHPDDGLRIDVRDEAPILSGSVGLRTYRVEAAFDNVVVLPISEVPEPAPSPGG